MVALGLENLALRYCAELADRAVHRAQPPGAGQRPGIGAQGTGEKAVKAVVGGDIAVGRLGHVHLVFADKPGNQTGGGAAPAPGGNPAAEGRQCLCGQQVLGPDRDARCETV